MSDGIYRQGNPKIKIISNVIEPARWRRLYLLVTSGGRQTLALKYRHEGKEKLEITKLTPQVA